MDPIKWTPPKPRPAMERLAAAIKVHGRRITAVRGEAVGQNAITCLTVLSEGEVIAVFHGAHAVAIGSALVDALNEVAK